MIADLLEVIGGAFFELVLSWIGDRQESLTPVGTVIVGAICLMVVIASGALVWHSIH
jgi:hypothetical protein